MWTGSDGLLSRRDLRVFVPEGLESLCPGGTRDSLSRRDSMIVARQFIAWNVSKRRPVP